MAGKLMESSTACPSHVVRMATGPGTAIPRAFSLAGLQASYQAPRWSLRRLRFRMLRPGNAACKRAKRGTPQLVVWRL